MTAQISDTFWATDINGFVYVSLPSFDHPDILRLQQPHLSQDDLRFGSPYDSTACYGGYVAGWSVRESSLFLTQLHGYYKLRDGKPVLAKWFSGWLLVAHGEPLDTEFFVYEHCRAYLIREGEVLRHVDRARIERLDQKGRMVAHEFRKAHRRSPFDT